MTSEEFGSHSSSLGAATKLSGYRTSCTISLILTEVSTTQTMIPRRFTCNMTTLVVTSWLNVGSDLENLEGLALLGRLDTLGIWYSTSILPRYHLLI